MELSRTNGTYSPNKSCQISGAFSFVVIAVKFDRHVSLYTRCFFLFVFVFQSYLKDSELKSNFYNAAHKSLCYAGYMRRKFKLHTR